MWALVAALLSSLGAFLFGLDIGYIAPILSSPEFRKDMGGSISDSMEGFVVGVFSLGCIITAFPTISGYFLDAWGRRDSIVLGTAVFLIGCGLQAAAMSISQFLIGRLVSGLSIGLLSTVVALYQSEVAPTATRGAFTSLYQLMITLGILVASMADEALIGHRSGWRHAILLQMVPALVILAGLPCMPRSPRWLVQKGRQDEALRSLRRFRDSCEDAEAELEEIAASVAEAAKLSPSWSELFEGLTLRLLLLGMSLQLLQQLVGMNSIMYFGPRMFADLGLNPNRFQVITNLVNFASTGMAILCADRLGRRCLLAVGALGMLLPSLVLAALGSLYLGDTAKTPGGPVSFVMASMIFIFVASFAMSWGPMVWVYTAEMYPLRSRSWCMGLTVTANWIGNYVIGQLTPILLGSIGFLTFLIFGTCSFLALLVALWIPETSGVLLEHIGPLFEKRFGLSPSGGHHFETSYGATESAKSSAKA